MTKEIACFAFSPYLNANKSILSTLFLKKIVNFKCRFDNSERKINMNAKEFREFGYAAVDFIADYMENVHKRFALQNNLVDSL